METIELYTDASSDSVMEIQPPKKLPPPVIDLDVEDIVLNTKTKSTKKFIRSNFFKDGDIPKDSPNNNPPHWTSDMIKFYNDDWGGENQFIVEILQAKMDKHPSLWGISPKDLLFKQNRKNRSYLKCWNCCQFGHSVYQCKSPMQIQKCHMCGGAGHIETTCPNSICLNCGNQMNMYVLSCSKCMLEANRHCSRCYLWGHHFINCSDNWRRYHSTIGKTDVNIPQGTCYKSENEMWCCNCSKKGHHQIHCKARKQLSFPETFPYVASYDTAFNEDRPSHVVHDNQEKVASLHGTRIRETFHSTNYKYNDSKCMNNLSRLNHQKKSRKNKKKKKKRGLIKTPDFIPL